MKIERVEHDFKPISIVIESEKELSALKEIFRIFGKSYPSDIEGDKQEAFNLYCFMIDNLP